eukprot:157146-Chlamydomonas_euryale.AAC.1
MFVAGDTAVSIYTLVNGQRLDRPMVHDVMLSVSTSLRPRHTHPGRSTVLHTLGVLSSSMKGRSPGPLSHGIVACRWHACSPAVTATDQPDAWQLQKRQAELQRTPAACSPH